MAVFDWWKDLEFEDIGKDEFLTIEEHEEHHKQKDLKNSFNDKIVGEQITQGMKSRQELRFRRRTPKIDHVRIVCDNSHCGYVNEFDYSMGSEDDYFFDMVNCPECGTHTYPEIKEDKQDDTLE